MEEVVQVLHMNGGLGDSSYANNSLLQRNVLSLTKPIREEAISEVYKMINNCKYYLSIAELGCSSGPNTLLVAAELVDTVHKICRNNGSQLPEFLIQLNDLPRNDFNSIFQCLLPTFQQREEFRQGCCFVSAVPGSFYARLFPAKTLHFVHSSYSLMWLSKVPEGLEMNKDNIYMASESPRNVINAYYDQFQTDFSTFLKCRSEEVVSGGKMVLTILGRKTEEASTKECCYVWELLALSLKEMVSQGIIEEEKLHAFNIPQYTPSPGEVKEEVEKEGSFAINRLEASEIAWAAACSDYKIGGRVRFDEGDAHSVAQCMRSVTEPLLLHHFGQLNIDQLFVKYTKILSDRMSTEYIKFVNVTVSMTRKEE